MKITSSLACTLITILLMPGFYSCKRNNIETVPPQATARCGVYKDPAELEKIAVEAAQLPGFDPVHTPLSWVHFDGEHFRLEDGREFVIRGLDYAYNTVGYTDLEFNLEESDFQLMEDWGVTALRVRLRDTRAGWYPFTPPEGGYLEGLDQIIELAGKHGIYVIIATDGVEQLLGLNNRPEDVLYEQAKFRVGTRANDHWLRYMASIFARYRNVSTVLGFDAINEDYSFPPEVHDAECMRPAHEAMLIMLRAIDNRHVYFQQPAGWDYNNSLHVSLGHDLDDENRIFSTKWFAMNTVQQRMDEMLGWADQAGTPLFVCEAWVWDIISQPKNVILNQQRTALHLLDAHAVGWISNGYVPLIGLLQRDGSPIYLADEWIRPYPQMIDGTRQSLYYDFATRKLTLQMMLSGTGETTIYVPATHTYATGFKVSANNTHIVVGADGMVISQLGDALAWDKDRQIITLSGEVGAVDLIVESTDATPHAVVTRDARLDYQSSDFPDENEIIHPVYSAQEGIDALRDRMLLSGDFSPEEVDCIISGWKQSFSDVEFEIIARAALLQVDMRTFFGKSVSDCLPATP